MSARRRLDAELVRRGLVETRQQAQEAIAAGRVLVAGAPADKPARMVGADQPLVVTGPPKRFVSRGGDKLDAALERFGVDVRGRVVLDAGASTGGFTDCVLQRGAAQVISVDVGYGQLHERLRSDDRVEVRERTNVRTLKLDHPAEVVVGDLSFISLATVAPALLGENAAPRADVVLLVKPQFEAGRAEVSKGRGVLRDPVVWRRVLDEVRSALSAHGAAMMDVMVSPLKGADGNVEFLVHLRAHAGALGSVDDETLDAVVAEAAG
ncbi:MAG TPA: TlyA family RNA methyltransferase [Acidimicrobiales bacterium]|nr:TlyA family RNA methyltransferase [Acidimicrobiales bacterium]